MKTSKVLENNINNVGFWSGIFNAFKDFFNNGENKEDSYIASELKEVEKNLSDRANSLLKMLEPTPTKEVSKKTSRTKNTRQIDVPQYVPNQNRTVNKAHKEINIDDSEKVQEK